jgi:hypothetical protein
MSRKTAKRQGFYAHQRDARRRKSRAIGWELMKAWATGPMVIHRPQSIWPRREARCDSADALAYAVSAWSNALALSAYGARAVPLREEPRG